MDAAVLVVFIGVYFGLILGRLPGLALDRTGVALLGAIALLALKRISPDEVCQAVDLPTMALLFGLMVVSAQFRLGGFYSHLVRRLAGLKLSPRALLGFLIGLVGILSALLANDIVCLAVTPVLVEGCFRRGLNPKPFLLALACAANVGSAATLIGNPQNMLIGQVLRLDFGRYLWQAGPPAAMGLFLVWGVIAWSYAGRWLQEARRLDVAAPPLNVWQANKGLIVLAALVLSFLSTPWPREVLALVAAGVLLCSRRMRSREMLALIDWQLLVLFFSLFLINHALKTAGGLTLVQTFLASGGVRLDQPAWLFMVSALLSNIVSNVPAVMLLLPYAGHLQAGPVLALSSTLAGNFLIVGSIANIIVVDQASRFGVTVTWGEHARVGLPVTILSLTAAALWLWWGII